MPHAPRALCRGTRWIGSGPPADERNLERRSRFLSLLRGSVFVAALVLGANLALAANATWQVAIDVRNTRVNLVVVPEPDALVVTLLGGATLLLRRLNVLYTSVSFSGTSGIYKSNDTGLTWSRVSSAEMDSLIGNANNTNVEIAVGNSNNVYVGAINNGQLAGLFTVPLTPGASNDTYALSKARPVGPSLSPATANKPGDFAVARLRSVRPILNPQSP
jgi:hypothetical protein